MPFATQKPSGPVKHTHELSPHEHGLVVAKPYTGWLYSKRAPEKLVERCVDPHVPSFYYGTSGLDAQKWLRLLEHRSSFDLSCFDESVHKPRPGFKPPLLRFGFAFKFDQLLAYFDRWNLKLAGGATWDSVSGPDHNEGERSLIRWCMMEKMCLHLGERCGTVFDLAKPFTRDYLAMIEIYNNYDMEGCQFDDPQDEVEVIDILRRALDIGGHQSEPKWWYDMDEAVSRDGHPCYHLSICFPWSENLLQGIQGVRPAAMLSLRVTYYCHLTSMHVLSHCEIL